ncbi:MAG: beta-galactosidase [Halobacteriaceae archaeon]
MAVGTWYYPKHWPRERWESDIHEIADAGFETLRIGVFYWSSLEPERGEFTYDWLHPALDYCADAGLDVVFGTPTAAPPKWLVDEHPDILPEQADGTTRGWGSRRHYCFNSSTYREETERVVREVATHLADREAVVGWQVDNEFGWGLTARCYCDDCAAAFRGWLRERYDSIEALNEAWGNSFWSQDYGSFEAVEPPRETVANHHPSRLLAYYRFASDSVAEYCALQADLLREVNEDWFVAHNFMCDFPQVDPYRASESLDLVTWDNYPTLHGQIWTDDVDPRTYRAGEPHQSAMNHDLYRSVAGEPFWVMELQAGDTVATPHSAEPADGAMRAWAHHAVAHGASVANYFRYRRCRGGQEQYWGGLRRHDGSPDRGFHEAERAAEELAGLADLDAPEGDVAVLHDYDNLWALEIAEHADDFRYWDHLRAYYRPLRRRGLTVDVVPPTRDLSDYPAVVAPTMYVASPATVDALESYVADGGELLLTARSGVADEHNTLFDELPPGPLADLVGALVGQHESLPDDLETSVRYGPDEYAYSTWGEWLEPTTASVTGEHVSGVARGEPAVVENDYGAGSVTYAGVWPDGPLADALVRDVLDRTDLDTLPPVPERVQVSERDGYVWICNFSDQTVEVAADHDAEWVVGGPTVHPLDVAVTDADRSTLGVHD